MKHGNEACNLFKTNGNKDYYTYAHNTAGADKSQDPSKVCTH